MGVLVVSLNSWSDSATLRLMPPDEEEGTGWFVVTWSGGEDKDEDPEEEDRDLGTSVWGGSCKDKPGKNAGRAQGRVSARVGLRRMLLLDRRRR